MTVLTFIRYASLDYIVKYRPFSSHLQRKNSSVAFQTISAMRLLS